MYCITAPSIHSCTVELPASKSLTNRMLIINALAGSDCSIEGIALCDDTEVMLKALSSQCETIDTHNAGTAMRFLTAFFASQCGSHILTGSSRMQQRPIAPLVDALRSIGADITYLENDGFPPLLIKGTKLNGGKISVPAHISSQFISALLLIAPYTLYGLQLTLQGHVASRPYIDMTIALMRYCGVEVLQQNNTICVPPSTYQIRKLSIERDWSAAAFWYLIALVSEQSFCLPGLSTNSLQGDARAAQYFETLGVDTTQHPQGLLITPGRKAPQPHKWYANLSDSPDLAQPIILGCLLKGQHFCIEGLSNLRFKETDRIADTIAQAQKLGYKLSQPHEGCIAWDGEKCPIEQPIVIDPCNDHRMAMAFAPAAITHSPIFILSSWVINKSYPLFWEHLAMAGFYISDLNEKEAIQ